MIIIWLNAMADKLVSLSIQHQYQLLFIVKGTQIQVTIMKKALNWLLRTQKMKSAWEMRFVCCLLKYLIKPDVKTIIIRTRSTVAS